MRELLNAQQTQDLMRIIKEVTKLEAEANQDGSWDGSVSPLGIKRMIYGVFHNGFNESGEDMVQHMEDAAKERYLRLIADHQDLPDISFYVCPTCTDICNIINTQKQKT